MRDRPFSGASWDRSGTGEQRIIIGMADDDPANHLDHAVINPTRLAIDGDDLIISDATGTTTIVRFQRRREERVPAA